MYLLFDECCGNALPAAVHAMGHTAQRSKDVGDLGRAAPDRDILVWAARAGAVFVTINQGDFIRLAAAGQSHNGVLLLPALDGGALAKLLKVAMPAAEALLGPDVLVSVDGTGAVSIV